MTTVAGRFEPTRQVSLGRTDVMVTQMAIGTVPLSGLFEDVSYADARAVVEAGWESGVRFYDVAPLYGYGFAERVVGDVLREQPRESYSLATKVGRLLQTTGPADREDHTVDYDGEPRFADAGSERPFFDFTYDGVKRSIEASQERTGIDRFDILHIHDPEDFMDEATDGAYKALDELRSSGVVGAIGVGSNNWDCHLEMTRRGDFDCFLLAGRYSLLDQGALPELLPVCEARGIAVIAAGVYNSGILSHPDPGSISGVSRDASDMESWKDNVTFDYEPASAQIIAKAARIKDVCDRHGVLLAAAAVQFPLHHPAVACVLVGPRTPEHVRVNNDLLRFEIPDALWGELKHEGLLPESAPTP
jgi:D-threo-aldose 1-dehydrogenase